MLDSIFTFLQTHRSGVLLLLLSLAGIALLVQWFAWIFGLGRFGVTASTRGRAELRYVFSEATVKIINDFRHLLALVVVLIFALALAYSLYKASSPSAGESGSVVANMKEALQAVVATLGGLVGSIIGYYFGESSVAKAAVDAGTKPSPEIQSEAATEQRPAEAITAAPAPPAPPAAAEAGGSAPSPPTPATPLGDQPDGG